MPRSLTPIVSAFSAVLRVLRELQCRELQCRELLPRPACPNANHVTVNRYRSSPAKNCKLKITLSTVFVVRRL